MTQIIFVEGISGVGKSTMVRMLSDKLCEKGYKVKSYLEFDYTNPIDFYCTAYVPKDTYNELCAKYSSCKTVIQRNSIMTSEAVLLRYYDSDTPLFQEPLLSELKEMEFCYNPVRLVPLDEYTAIYKSVWEDFIADIDTEIDYYIFDGSLMHHPINDMMKNYNVSFERAACHVDILLGTLKGINWHVFYLYSDNIESQLRCAHTNRKQRTPTEKEIAFWNARYEKDQYVLKKGVLHYHIFNISNNGWNCVREQILSLL